MKIKDAGDASVTCIYLYTEILLAYSVNKKYVPWDECLVYHWTSTLWFNVFDKSDKTFCTNQSNMVTDSIAMDFLFPRYDVQNTRGTTTETREHTFGGLHIDDS